MWKLSKPRQRVGNTIPAAVLAALLAVVLLGTVSAPATAYRNELKSAKSYIKIGAYAQAVEQLQAALKDPALKGRKRQQAEADLKNARGTLAAEQFALGQKLEQRGEQLGALNAYRKASQYAPDNSQYTARFVSLDKQFSGARQQSTDILASTRQNLDWDNGLSALTALNAQGNVPEVRFALDQLKQDATQYYSGESDTALRQGHYQSALDYMVRAARFSESREVQNKKLARHHLLLSKRAWDERRYNSAYEDIQKGLSFEPENTELIAYNKRLKRQWLGVLYNEALQASSSGNLELARDKFTQISRFEPGYLDVTEQLGQLKQTLVSGYYQQAEDLMRGAAGESAGLALAYYMVAAEQQSGLYPDVYDKIATAKKRLRADMEFRISLKVKNSSGEPGASGIVRDNILSSLKGSSLKNLQVLEREALDDILQEQGLGQAFFDEATAVQVKKIKGIQSGIYVDVVKFTVAENGRDRPSFGSARYKSGTRFVPNPRYSQLQQEVANAQQRVLQTQQDSNRAQAEQNRLLGASQANSNDRSAAIASLGSILSSAGASSSHRAAQKELDRVQYQMAGEQPQLEEDVYSDFRYKIYDLELAGEVMLSYKIVDFTTSEISQSRAANARDVVTDRWVPGDPGKGVRSDPVELPSHDVFKKRLLDSAMESLITGLEQELGGGAASFRRKARLAAENGDREQAIENFIRYLYGGADLSGEQARAASDYLYEELGIQLLRRKR